MGGETTEMSSTTTRVLVEVGVVGPGVDVPHRPASQDHLRGRQAQRARRRPDHLRGRGRPGGRAADDVRRRHRRARRDGRRRRRRARRRSRSSYDLPARVTGMAIDAATVVANLEAVGCAVHRSDVTLTATPPPWRPDLTDPFDLVEEVARIVGYVNVPSVLPPAPAGRGLTRGQRLRRRIGRTLAGAGYVEVISFPFIGTAQLDALGLDAADERRQTLRLANPMSSEEPSMTTTLLPGPADDRRPQRRPRQRRRRAVRDRHRDPAARRAGRADPAGRPAPDRRRVGRPQQGAPRPAAAPRPA